MRRREGCDLVAEQDGQQDGDEVLAVGDEREEPVDGDDLVLEAEREARVVSTCTSLSMDFYASAAAGKET